MRFLYPLGLLGLIGVPILIIIYIIKNKYTEQTIPSTYLWELSERFLKRKKRVNPLAGLLRLILQLIMVTCLSFALAHPIVVLPNEAQELCILVDVSGSMNMSAGGESRLDRAKEYAEDKIKSSVDGSLYSIITVSSDINVLCKRTEDKSEALGAVEALSNGNAKANDEEAARLAQEYFDNNAGTKVIFLTDREFTTTENVQVVNFAGNEKNAAITLTDAELVDTTLTVNYAVEAYGLGSNVDLTVELYVNGAAEASQTVSASVKDGESASFTFTQDGVTEFDRAKVRLTGVSDDYSADNESVFFSVASENAYDVLVVSDTPFLISTAIKAAGTAQITTLSPSAYDGERGYELYVFDGYAPDDLPSDGAIWFMNIKKSIPGTGFSFQAEEALAEGETLTISDSSSSLAQKLLAGMSGGDIYIAKYLRYGRSKHFVPLMTYKNTPVLFTGETDAGNREVVFAFDIHDTDFPLQTDFEVLVGNLLNYSFPSVVDKVVYNCGETLGVNVVSGMNSIRIESPSGKYVYLPTSNLVAEFSLTEVGVHKITVSYGEENLLRDYFVYSSVPATERNPYTLADYVGVQGEASDVGLDGKFDTINIFFVLIALTFVVDWVVYCYDKYQLR